MMKRYYLPLFAVILITGCGGALYSEVNVTKALSTRGLGAEVNVTRALNARSLGTVAVLEFSGYRGEAFADFISQELLKQGIDVIEGSRISAILSERNIQMKDIALGKVELQMFHKILGVDVLVFGSVSPIIIYTSGLSSNKVSTASVRLVSVLDGKILSSAAYRNNSDYLPGSPEYPEVAERLIKSIFKMRE
jgi:hypothetical protein